jgi:hypothetical protein
MRTTLEKNALGGGVSISNPCLGVGGWSGFCVEVEKASVSNLFGIGFVDVGLPPRIDEAFFIGICANDSEGGFEIDSGFVFGVGFIRVVCSELGVEKSWIDSGVFP